jgi:hypothetical protein
MGRIAALLADCPPDRSRASVRKMLTPDQWTEIIAAYERGVSVRTIFAKCSGTITPFFNDPVTLRKSLGNERTARKKAVAKK